MVFFYVFIKSPEFGQGFLIEGVIVRSTLVVCARKLDSLYVRLFVCPDFPRVLWGGKDVGVRATEHAEFEKWILKKPFFKLISG